MKIFYAAIMMMSFGSWHAVYPTAVPSSAEQTVLFTSDHTALGAEQVITKFLRWYKINLHKAAGFPVLTKDKAGNFMVNKTASEQYLSLLKSSGCVSSRYIAYWRSFFNDQATGLENNPVQEDIPENFDLDFVLITQEPELVLDHIPELKMHTMTISKNDLMIGVSRPGKDEVKYNFEMHRNAAGWQIDYISSPNFD